MGYTADGFLAAPNYEMLNGRIKAMQDRLDHANDRYRRLRTLVDFYQTLGADDAMALNKRYRDALQMIADMDPEMQEMSVASMMAATARNALKP